MTTQHRQGVVEAVAASIGFGFFGVLAKQTLALGIPGGMSLAIRFLIASGILWIAVLIRGRGRPGIDGRGFLTALLLGIVGYASFTSCLMVAIDGLSASLAVLLLFTFPVPVTLGAWWLFGERPGARRLAILPVVLAGMALLVLHELQVQRPVAVAFGLGSALLYGVYILGSRRLLRNVAATPAVATIQLGAGLVLAAFHMRDPDQVAAAFRDGWAPLLSLALVCTAGPMLLFIRSLQKLAAAEVALYSTVEPVAGVLLAMVFLGETLVPLQWLGAVLVLGAIILMALDPNQG